MSRIQFLGASLIAVFAAVGTASAADLGYEPPPAAPEAAAIPEFTWGGAYIGLQGGYSWNSVDDGYIPFDTNGFLGGIYGGYNFQAANNFIVGLEADANLKDAQGTNGITWYDNPWDASLRLRAGFAVNRFLIYAAGGATVGTVEASDGAFTESKTKIGWNAGAGVEAMITNNVIGRIEFRHTDLGSSTYALSVPTQVDSSSNAVLVGVGLKF
jgi:outer membrane immunogenic protein